jgi:hypothetical protein
MSAKLAALVAVLLSGCDTSVEKLLDRIGGRESDVVVLAKQPVVLTDSPTTLSGSEPLRVLGEWTSVCLVLRDGVPLQAQEMLDRSVSSALGGAKVKVVLLLDSGARVTLNEPLPGWSRSGRVLPKDELSACASAVCKSELSVGMTVKNVELSATPKLEVRGVFWQSQRGPIERANATSSDKVPQSKCPDLPG